MRRLFFIACLLAALGARGQASTLQSPQQFLGYTLGTQYTPYYKVEAYFRYMAANAPNVHLQQYGTTYENRPLLLAIVSSPDNMQHLDDIRRQNLAVANAQGSFSENAPVIVWLSYNVHGNEASSTEASMQTLYELVNPRNARTKQWLQNTVVLIDPCLNPDGRERYVNFYNPLRRKQPDPLRTTREHQEPWPGGRPNHYYFDLNRDWAWQSQKESQQRLAVYNEWMPAVHVDFHEQSVEGPYYFAPAAEPMHEVITPWQRSFQVTIGKNNAKYFDEQGWLYYTKERYDLFYPSYGDTYPLYNGAIGMTYEQAGGSFSGLAVLQRDGDTLTLTDRVAHHFTTGMSTIEVASQQAKQVNDAFHTFFEEASQHPKSEYKAYVVKADGNPEKLHNLAAMLQANHILVGYGATTSTATGYNYFTGKTAAFNIAKEDLVISAFQPRSTMLQVLFEPNSHLTDSVTYDITAWAMPFAYGLTAYALKTPLKSAAGTIPARKYQHLAASHPYAYLAKWNSIKDVKFLAGLLQKHIKVRYAETPFSAGGKTYSAGTLIITRNGNAVPAFDTSVTSLAEQMQLDLDTTTTGFVDKGSDFGSSKNHYIKPPRVVMLSGSDASSLRVGEVWHYFEQQIDYPISIVNEEDLGDLDWEEMDVLILPGGNYPMLAGKAVSERLRNWVSAGGRLIAIGSAAADLSESGDWGFHLKHEPEPLHPDPYQALKPYANREREEIKQSIPGAIYRVYLDNTHPLAFGYGNDYYTLKLTDVLFDFTNNGWNVGYLKKDSYQTGFVGVNTKTHLQDGLVMGVKDIGNGSLIVLADDPIFRGFWENGKLLLANAIFLVGQ
ncbi:Zinc carboxypeptidase [Chitinophaga costaii]|uniref:Zinc carboxypeptidase n=1 Tax=Chitinophaga costaii TaxID=1335309 RepID=A0A1C4ER45_9BACT|nr:M14 family metallopeptidase [Chitinophaga costaii]PUZ22534.1 zinc carboxypeptidase [Chitinophaga costaii]SCC46056.1 Zinc carboxypeptidase [Chitinophaga costaii]